MEAEVSNNDSGDLSYGGATVGWLSGAVAGWHIAALVTAVTGGLGVVAAPLIVGACAGAGTMRGLTNRKSPTSPGMDTAGSAADLINGQYNQYHQY